MTTLLLCVIYLAFVSLGLPDSLLGSAWPVIHVSMDVPLSWMGLVSMIISAGTIISSLLSDRLIRRLGTKYVVAFSVLLTALALLGFSFADRFWILCLIAIPYGLGAGAIDAALNNYVALHYSSRHMSWLHCCWGVGTLISPYFMSYAIGSLSSWHYGYRIVSYIQMGIAFLMFLSIPLWDKTQFQKKEEEEVVPSNLTFTQKLALKGVIFVIIGFFAYCAFETTTINWASTYLVEYRGISEETAAAFASLFLIGMTLGRFVSGLITNKVGDTGMIRLGSMFIALGLLLVFLPFKADLPCLIGLVIIGFGAGPIYPAIVHATPSHFGKENSQAIIGLQMASAYLGSTFMSPLFGIVANYVNIALFPYYILFFFAMMIVFLEILNKVTGKKKN